MAEKSASLFTEEVAKIFPSLQNIVEKINGKRTAPNYIYKEALRREYSANDSWETGSVNTQFVAADMVAMDSPLPIKKRATVAYSNGVLPKIGMAKVMKESDLKAVDLMKARGEKWANIANKLIQDAVSCSTGIDEKNEYNFLSGLSNGYVLIPDQENSALGHRFNFKYFKRNVFGVATTNTLTIDDMEKVIVGAAGETDGNTITHVWLSLTQYNKLRRTEGAKQLVADYRGIMVTNTSKLSVPTKSVFDEAIKDHFGIEFVVVDRLVKFEKNGVVTNYRPWNDNRVIYTTSKEVGAFVYGTLAEENHKAQGVDYTSVDGYKLISKFSNTNPLREMTAAQAECLPVIEDVDRVYVTDITKAWTDRMDEGSADWEKPYEE